MAGHIFLSYKREEYAFALSLATRLKLAGINVWMDKFEIKTGDNFSKELQQALNNCIGLIAVLSPDYFKSRYCPNELMRAYNLPRPIFPVIHRKIKLEETPLELEGTNYIDLSDIEDPDDAPERLNQLIADIRAKANASIGTSPDLTEQYLIGLIKDLETRKGVLEYVELEAAWVKSEERPHPHLEDEWLSEFSSLVMDGAEGRQLVRTGIGEAAQRNPVFMLLGEPGTGKTTTLRRLASDTAKERLENRLAPIPLVAYLSQWDRKYPTPQAFLEDQWPLSDPPLLNGVHDGTIALYLDGLNEMGMGSVPQAQQLRDWLLGPEKTRPKRCIITCRTADYVGDVYFGEAMPEVTCQPLTQGRIEQFTRNYLTAEGQAEKFLSVILPKGDTDARHLFTLAQNPYLLSALLFVFSQKGEIARNTGDLFKRMVDKLWEREGKRKTQGWVPHAQMLTQLAYLAFTMIDENKPTELATWWAWLFMTPLDFKMNLMLPVLGVAGAMTDNVWLLKLLKPLRKRQIELLKVARAATLIDVRGSEEHKQKFRFYHQLMQEYFAAEEVLKRGITTLLEAPKVSQLRRVAQKWDQVIIAACGVAKDKDTLVKSIAAIDPYLAAECIGSGITVQQDTLEQLFFQLLPYTVQDTDTESVARDAISKLSLTHAQAKPVDDWLRETYLASNKGKTSTAPTRNGKDVFISYRRTDQTTAQYIVENLKRADIMIWQDNNELIGGANWTLRVEQAINGAKIFLIIIGQETLSSPYVRAEVEYALEHHKSIVPILLEGVDYLEATRELPALQTLKYLVWSDRSKRGVQPTMDQLIRTIRERLLYSQNNI